jgi:hypothetical protein
MPGAGSGVWGSEVQGSEVQGSGVQGSEVQRFRGSIVQMETILSPKAMIEF